MDFSYLEYIWSRSQVCGNLILILKIKNNHASLYCNISYLITK